MEFFFEEVGAALGIAKIFGGIAASLDLEGDGTPLKGGVEIEDALAMRMVQAFGDADEGGEAAGDALVIVIEDRIGGMVASGFRLTVVIADDGSDDVAIAAVQTGDVSIQGQIFPVLVVGAMADAMAQIVKKGAGFQLDAGLNG